MNSALVAYRTGVVPNGLGRPASELLLVELHHRVRESESWEPWRCSGVPGCSCAASLSMPRLSLLSRSLGRDRAKGREREQAAACSPSMVAAFRRGDAPLAGRPGFE